MMQSKKERHKLKTMVRGGVPAELRPRVWHFFAGASTKRAAQLDGQYYERLLESVDKQEEREKEVRATTASMCSTASGISSSGPRSELAATLDQIEKDLGRTFPGHSVIAAPEGQAQLRRLLRAYCAGRNPRTGYCQGMNFVAAMMLLMMGSEQDAFWMFLLTIERLLPADYYIDGLVGVRVDSSVTQAGRSPAHAAAPLLPAPPRSSPLLPTPPRSSPLLPRSAVTL